MTPNLPRRVSAAILWLTVVAYAALIVRHFFHLSTSAIYLSTDDGLANISYALATEGRYGFLSSPVLLGMARDHGLFSYGPFYFFVGAALIWLFGYSLTLVRSIHLAVVLGIALAGRRWFGRAAAGAAAAIFAIGLLEAFDRAQWPMVRPDSMVSLFAVALVICAGLALRTGRRRYWWGAGLAAACGAFTHLVAWSLIPAAVAMLAVGTVVDAIDEDGRWRRPPMPWGAALATATGGLTGTFLFYASFGFRVRDQISFLAGYRELTGSLGATQAPTSTYLGVLLAHFRQAYWYLPWPLGKVVWATLATAVALVVLVLLVSRLRRRDVLALLAPPLIVWLFYLLSLGVYNNFHAGYAILNQVMWLWTLAAIGNVLLYLLEPWPVLRRTSAVLGWIVAMGLGIGMLTLLAQRTDYRSLADASFVSIEEYTARILEPLPARARCWGSVVFGIEHPGRIQLVQFDDATRLVGSVAPAARAPLAPDYLVWGFAENRSNTLLVAGGAAGLTRTLADELPGARYSLVSMTAGAPYGVARVYVRSDDAPALDRPIIGVYDPRSRQWNGALAPAEEVALSPSTAARFQIGQESGSPVRTATQTLTGALPAGTYLLRVAMTAGAPTDGSAIVVATSTAEIRDPFGQFGTDFDVSPWFANEEAVHLLYRHGGGPFFLSQFGSHHDAMAGLEASRILPLTDYRIRRAPKPLDQSMPASRWVAPYPDTHVTPAADGTVNVLGNRTQYGYQAYGPRISVAPGQQMLIDLKVTVSQGTACLGVLDEAGKKWVVVPDQLQPQYEFLITDSRVVRPVLADCSTSPEQIVPIVASIGPGRYAISSDADELYVDLLMRAWKDAKRP